MTGLPPGLASPTCWPTACRPREAGQRLAAAPRLRLITPGSAAGPEAEDLPLDAMERLVAELSDRRSGSSSRRPPVMSGPDVYTLAHVADAAVLVAEVPRTRTNHVRDGVRHLEKMGAPVLGAVLLPAPGARPGGSCRSRPGAHRPDWPSGPPDAASPAGVAAEPVRTTRRDRGHRLPAGRSRGGVELAARELTAWPAGGTAARRAGRRVLVRRDRRPGRVFGRAPRPPAPATRRPRRPRPAINRHRRASARPPGPTGTVAPLTGLAVTAAVAQRPAVAVAVSGPDPAGLGSADLVFEEMSSPVRYLAVFQSAEANAVGPVASTRPTDGQALSVLHPLTGYAGGTASFISVLDATKIVDVGYPGHASLYAPASGGLTVSTAALAAAGRSDGPPPGLFSYRAPGAPLASVGAPTRPRSGWTCRASRSSGGTTTPRRPGGCRPRAARG